MKLYRGRRIFQTAFLIAFFVLLTLTVWPLGQIFFGAFLLADPLVALNSLASGVWKWQMVLAVPFLILPFVLGRAFCGYICPFGFLIELLGPRSEKKTPQRLTEVVRKFPPYVLIVSLGLLVFGAGVFLVFDPIAFLTRSSTTLLYPLLDALTRLSGDMLYLVPFFRGTVDAITTALSGRIIFDRPLTYALQLTMFLMALAVFAFSYLRRRMWCRDLCPLGALFGQLSRVSLFGRVVDEGACIECGKCAKVCPLDAIRDDGRATDKTRCQLSFECADVCPTNAIRFGMRPRADHYDPSRRSLLTAGGLAVASGFFLTTSGRRRHREPLLIRPPGAQPDETAFLALCSRCEQCMKVCPTNVLQPAILSAGLEGMFTPMLDFTVGFCEFSCHECSKICPTGAIEPLVLATKQRTVIGRAYIDENRCIPYVDFTNCLVCEELCPTPQKAIVFEEATVRDPDGALVRLKRPKVKGDLCIGCGVCEYYCPVPSERAVIVQSIDTGISTAL